MSTAFFRPEMGLQTMQQQISEDYYWEEVETQANVLGERVKDEAGKFDDRERLAVEMAELVIEGHPWFTSENPSMHGEIIEYNEAEPYLYGDTEQHLEGKPPEAMVLEIAFACFEADVIDSVEV